MNIFGVLKDIPGIEAAAQVPAKAWAPVLNRAAAMLEAKDVSVSEIAALVSEIKTAAPTLAPLLRVLAKALQDAS